MKRLVGISIGHLIRTLGEKNALDAAKKAGADAVDFNLTDQDLRRKGSIYAQGEEAVRDHYTKLGAYAKSIGILISQTHGRFEGLRGDAREDEVLLQNLRLDLIATAALGAPVCVLHTTTTIWLGPDADPEEMFRLNRELFYQVIPFAKSLGIRVATETFGDAVGFDCVDFFGDMENFLRGYLEIKEVPDLADGFTVCVDTGHSNKAMLFGNPNPADVIRRIGADIQVLHLNDNDGLTDQHKLPMSGNIDWNDVLDALDEVGYTGVYNMELKLGAYGDEVAQQHAAFAVAVMRNMLKKRYPQDFAE